MSRIRKGVLALALSAALFLAPAALVADEGPVAPTRAAYESIHGQEALDHIKVLASDEYEGRDTGSEGERKAADYIVRHFKEWGLEPVGDGGTYFQRYSIGDTSGLGEKNALSIRFGGETVELAVGKDFHPFSFSANARVEGELVFAGYGITSTEPAYDDYAGLDVSGKVVLILRHEPQQKDASSPFAGAEWSRHAFFETKVKNAEVHGAAALVIVNDPVFGEDGLFGLSGAGDAGTSIPAVHLTAAAGERLFERAGKNLEETQKAIDAELKPVTFSLGGTATVESDLVKKELETRNIVGMVRGSDPAVADEIVIVGGHYDHVGYGYFGSTWGARGAGKIHNGADDNASGTSAVLELAQAFATPGLSPRRSVLFMLFSGEERGLLGSQHYCDHPIFPLEKTVAMVNLDMVGRGETGKFSVNGVGTSPGFKEMCQKIEAAIEKSSGADLKLRYGESGFAPSDNTSFYQKRIPVLFFFTGTHDDYHAPTDDWDKINVENLDLATKIAFFVLVDLSILRETRPEFNERGLAAGGGGGPHPDSPILGIYPGESEEEGVLVERVIPGAPAEKAGLQGGDLIVGLGDRDIAGMEDLFEALAAHKVGDEVDVKIVRDGEERTIKATLGKRQR